MDKELERLERLLNHYYNLVKNGNKTALADYLKIVETKQRIINSTLKEERDKYYTLSQEFYKLLELHYKTVFTSENLEQVRDGLKTEVESLAVDLFVSGKLDPALLSPFKSE
ncbi:hypothetical protein [Laspinema olomoucense]|uniref:Uncharacterized protein n=1 Tax=Laspinema olomoucense D3b TaxID=2953688 RepID=A0ABT2NFY5_9CYAN|nr:hypothetical protein [Laspinema sp. D3b]MCT7981603.1 hypothetical protein [Laspinema sp. D3b]